MPEAPPFSVPKRFRITLTLPQCTLGAFNTIKTLGNRQCFGIAGTLGCHTKRRLSWILHKETVDTLGYRTRRRFSHLAIAWSSQVCIWRVATKWQIRLRFRWPDLCRIALPTSIHVNRKPDWSWSVRSVSHQIQKAVNFIQVVPLCDNQVWTPSVR